MLALKMVGKNWDTVFVLVVEKHMDEMLFFVWQSLKEDWMFSMMCKKE